MRQPRLLFFQQIDCSDQLRPFQHCVRFEVETNAKIIRMNITTHSEQQSNSSNCALEWAARYLDHPSLNVEQKNLAVSHTKESISHLKGNWGTVHLFDSRQNFRGRWDSGFCDWKYVAGDWASPGFMKGALPTGQWSAYIFVSAHAPADLKIDFHMDWTDEIQSAPAMLSKNISEFEYPVGELCWHVGELHEHTTRSSGNLSLEETIGIYQELGYHFLALTDHDVPPICSFPASTTMGITRGQELETFHGHALLLGTGEQICRHQNGHPRMIDNLIIDTHNSNGLFCVVHPFSMSPTGSAPAWVFSETAWRHVDLLEIWPGKWKDRFPEIMKAFDFWDSLLNQGIRIVGVCGKGSKGRMNHELVEQLPKMLVYAESRSETHILSGLKQGRCYATIEAAITFWLESEYGGAMIGDELRLPVGEGFLMRLEVSCLPSGGFLRIKSNEGIFCEMPLSSVHDTNLKLIETAKPEIRWYRVEIYRYGRPLDELLGFTNPIYVRGVVSARAFR
jgi:hypothetical protein